MCSSQCLCQAERLESCLPCAQVYFWKPHLSLQWFSLGYDRRGNLQKVFLVEMLLPLKGWEAHSAQKYHFQLTQLLYVSLSHPQVLSLRLQKIYLDFLQGGGAFEKKPYLVIWLSICMDEKKRAIARRAISFPNKVLFGKWSQRFTLERDFLWRLVIVRK